MLGSGYAVLSEIQFFEASVAPGDTFSDWISDFTGLGGLTAFDDDPDGDGLKNGIEAWFGTDPGQFTQGLSGTATDGTTTTFTHPQSASAPTDLSGYYEWSPNLTDWYGTGPGGGATVSFSSDTVGTTTTVTATASEALNRVFLRAVATQD